MENNEGNKKFEYFAFISYKREDEKWAKWLQKKLEYYRIPIEIRRNNPGLPERIRPVFKDTTDLEPGLLSDKIKKALEASKFLIVVCSPRSAKSEWVTKEVQTFIDSGRTNYIIPFIIEGKPNSINPREECFPEGLRQLSGNEELLGANINEMGREAAAIKVISRMFNLRFDTLWQRFQKNKNRKRLLIILISFCIVLISTIVSLIIIKQNSKLRSSNHQLNIQYCNIITNQCYELINKGELLLPARLLLNLNIPEGSIAEVPKYELCLRNLLYKLNTPGVLKVSYVPMGSGEIDDISRSPYGGISISHHGDKYAIAINGFLYVYSLNNGKKIWEKFQEGDCEILVFSNDDNYLIAAGSNGKVNIYDYNNDKIILSKDIFDYYLSDLIVTSNNHIIVCGGNETYENSKGAEIKEFDFEGSLIREFKSNFKIDQLRLSPTNQLYGAGEGGVNIYSLENGSLMATLEQDGENSEIGFSNSEFIYTFSSSSNRVNIWNTKGHLLKSIQFEFEPQQVDGYLYNDTTLLIKNLGFHNFTTCKINLKSQEFSEVKDDIWLMDPRSGRGLGIKNHTMARNLAESDYYFTIINNLTGEGYLIDKIAKWESTHFYDFNSDLTKLVIGTTLRPPSIFWINRPHLLIPWMDYNESTREIMINVFNDSLSLLDFKKKYSKSVELNIENLFEGENSIQISKDKRFLYVNQFLYEYTSGKYIMGFDIYQPRSIAKFINDQNGQTILIHASGDCISIYDCDLHSLITKKFFEEYGDSLHKDSYPNEIYDIIPSSDGKYLYVLHDTYDNNTKNILLKINPYNFEIIKKWKLDGSRAHFINSQNNSNNTKDIYIRIEEGRNFYYTLDANGNLKKHDSPFNIPIYRMALDYSGSKFGIISNNGEIIIFNPLSSKVENRFSTGYCMPISFTFDQTGRYIMILTRGDELAIYDLLTSRKIFETESSFFDDYDLPRFTNENQLLLIDNNSIRTFSFENISIVKSKLKEIIGDISLTEEEKQYYDLVPGP